MKRYVLGGVAAAVVLLVASSLVFVAGLPSRADVRALTQSNPDITALMRQREEEARSKGLSPRRVQSWVPLASVSRHLIHAVIASEDQRFFGHAGVDWEALQESLEKNVERRRVARGGSTITQQLAKNLFFGTHKTLLRKARELIVARWLEADLTKPRILALYLNLIEWGDGIYGCEAAARHWYGKAASDLEPAEAAGLAAMIPNPRRINPRVSPRGHERATRRVLGLMQLAGYIGRDVAGLGAEPPPEPDEDEAAVPGDGSEEGEGLTPQRGPEEGEGPAPDVPAPDPAAPDGSPEVSPPPSPGLPAPVPDPEAIPVEPSSRSETAPGD